MKTKYIPIFIALSLLVTGCQEKSSVKEQSKVAVKVTLLRQGSDPLHAIGYSGTLDANTAVNLSFQVSGTILNIPVEMGDYVKKGQLIAQIDPTTYQNQYNAAKAQAELAR
ncbi:MAG: biotin/lipoyl-binding protein, partial [Leeuwenhoekiella sp.]